MGAKQTDRDGYDLTLNNLSGREYIYLISALEDQHEVVHRAEESDYAQPKDVDAIHHLLEEVQHDALEAEAHEIALESFERLVNGGAVDFDISMQPPREGGDVEIPDTDFDPDDFDGTDIDIE